MTEADREAAGGYIERRHRSQRLWTQLLLQRSSVKGQKNRNLGTAVVTASIAEGKIFRHARRLAS